MEISEKEIIEAFKDQGAMKLQLGLHEISTKELYDRVGKLEVISTRTDEGFKSIKCSVDKMEVSVSTALSSFADQLKKLQLDPGENWKLMKRTIITSVVSGVVAIVLGVLGAAYLSQQYQDKINNMQMKYQSEIDNLKNAIGQNK